VTPIPADFLSRLAGHVAPAVREPFPERRAAVAAILREGSAGPEVLLMRRIEHEADPWSGHVSFPGGNVDASDATLLDTAMRETREEVALDLARDARLVCRLASLEAVGRRLGFEMDITPFVFRLEAEVTPVAGAEAQAVFWLPLLAAARGELDGQYRWNDGAVTKLLPCWNFGGHTVWGMTHRMLSSLLVAGGVSRPAT